MERQQDVTFDMDRDTRNSRTQKALHDHGMTNVHVLTMGTTPTLVLLEAADELGFVEVVKAQGWDSEKIVSSSAGNPAYWVRHPSPFAAQSEGIRAGRLFASGSPCPHDVDFVQHQNGLIFRRMARGECNPTWRAMREHGGDGDEYSWTSMNGTTGDGSPMVEVFLPATASTAPIEDLKHVAWRAVEAVVDFDRLQDATTPVAVADLVYDAVVGALKAVKE